MDLGETVFELTTTVFHKMSGGEIIQSIVSQTITFEVISNPDRLQGRSITPSEPVYYGKVGEPIRVNFPQLNGFDPDDVNLWVESWTEERNFVQTDRPEDGILAEVIFPEAGRYTGLVIVGRGNQEIRRSIVFIVNDENDQPVLNPISEPNGMIYWDLRSRVSDLTAGIANVGWISDSIPVIEGETKTYSFVRDSGNAAELFLQQVNNWDHALYAKILGTGDIRGRVVIQVGDLSYTVPVEVRVEKTLGQYARDMKVLEETMRVGVGNTVSVFTPTPVPANLPFHPNAAISLDLPENEDITTLAAANGALKTFKFEKPGRYVGYATMALEDASINKRIVFIVTPEGGPETDPLPVETNYRNVIFKEGEGQRVNELGVAQLLMPLAKDEAVQWSLTQLNGDALALYWNGGSNKITLEVFDIFGEGPTEYLLEATLGDRTYSETIHVDVVLSPEGQATQIAMPVSRYTVEQNDSLRIPRPIGIDGEINPGAKLTLTWSGAWGNRVMGLASDSDSEALGYYRFNVPGRYCGTVRYCLGNIMAEALFEVIVLNTFGHAPQEIAMHSNGAPPVVPLYLPADPTGTIISFYNNAQMPGAETIEAHVIPKAGAEELITLVAEEQTPGIGVFDIRYSGLSGETGSAWFDIVFSVGGYSRAYTVIVDIHAEDQADLVFDFDLADSYELEVGEPFSFNRLPNTSNVYFDNQRDAFWTVRNVIGEDAYRPTTIYQDDTGSTILAFEEPGAYFLTLTCRYGNLSFSKTAHILVNGGNPNG